MKRRRIATFEMFSYNESASHDKVLIFGHDQFTKFYEALVKHKDVQVEWEFVEERSWDNYVEPGMQLALINTFDSTDGKELIAALLDEDGYTLEAQYNDKSPCEVDVADNYVQSMNSFTTESIYEKETCGACGCDCDICECDECDCGTNNDWKNYRDEEKHYEKRSTSYKKSGLKHPEKADLNKDKKISGYEKTRGKAIQKSVQSAKEEKGLSAKQKKLPEGLRKAIEKRMKKK